MSRWKEIESYAQVERMALEKKGIILTFIVTVGKADYVGPDVGTCVDVIVESPKARFSWWNVFLVALLFLLLESELQSTPFRNKAIYTLNKQR